VGNLRAHGHPSGGPWRQLHCTGCDGYFLETHGTLFHGKRVSGDRIVHVIGCLAAGLGMRGTARGFEVAPHTVLHGLMEATAQLPVFSANNPPGHAHERARKSSPEAELRADEGVRSVH